MRLFIASNLSTEVKKQVGEIKNKLKENSSQGKFVNEEHMHLTIEFLGEMEKDRVDLIKKIMDEVGFEPFTLKLNKIGCFKRREGNVYWLGIDENDTLIRIHDTLHRRLKDEGFKVEDRDFKPHLTLVRRGKLEDGFDINTLNSDVEKIEIDIESIDLMESLFTDGRLRYTSVYSKK